MKTFVPLHWLCCTSFLCAVTAFAASPGEIQSRIDSGEKIIFVDVRSTTLFQNGHVPGAINVPAALVPQKQLPPLGRVIVYDEGLGRDTATAAAEALNQKSGITAEVLEGGFAAWEASRATTTKSAGLKPEEMPMITYAHLKVAEGDDVVLVDLRKTVPAAAKEKAAAKSATPPLTDLQAEFPRARVSQSPFNVGSARPAKAGDQSVPPLLVLIDNGDGSAQAMARTLKANGIKRFAILAGGETTLARKGEPGLGRAASTMVVRRPPGDSVTNTNR